MNTKQGANLALFWPLPVVAKKDSLMMIVKYTFENNKHSSPT